MLMRFHSDRAQNLPESLRRTIWLTWLGMLIERAAHAFWPVASLLLLALGAAFFGLNTQLGNDVRAFAFYVWGAMLIASALFGLFRFQTPKMNEARARLDESLPGWPLSAWKDEQSIGADDPQAAALWQAHQAQLETTLHKARPAFSEIRLSQDDPFALRYVAVIFFTISVIFGTSNPMASFGDWPTRTATQETAFQWEGWITPPAYTGLPTLYLMDQSQDGFEVPQGSTITLQLYDTVELRETVSSLNVSQNNQSQTIEFRANVDGEIAIDRQKWHLRILPDTAPFVFAEGAMEIDERGVMRLPYSASDDYGISTVEAVVSLDLPAIPRRHGLQATPDDAQAFQVPLTLSLQADPSDFNGTWEDDFSQHPWANLPVRIALRAFDALGQSGDSTIEEINLPGRRFFDPLAGAIIEQRRDLLWARSNGRRVSQILRALIHQSDAAYLNETHEQELRKTIRVLETSLSNGSITPQVQQVVAQRLWEVAVNLETGDLEDAKARMEQAQERLNQAMRNGASQAEIEALMKELREATENYMRHLQDQNANNGESSSEGSNENTLNMTAQDIQRMMDRIQELMEQGRMAEAQEALRELQEMLENMQVQEGQTPQEGDGAGLSESLRKQQELNDQTFQDFQKQFDFFGQTPEEPDSQGETSDLAQRQEALRNDLNTQEDDPSRPSNSEAQDALDEAGRAMGRAAEALRENDLGRAIDNQAQAMQAMREAQRAINEENNSKSGASEQPSQDPLGRSENQGQGNPSSQGELHEGNLHRQAQDLLAEIRRRSAQGKRSDEELKYLKRLLDRF